MTEWIDIPSNNTNTTSVHQYRIVGFMEIDSASSGIAVILVNIFEKYS